MSYRWNGRITLYSGAKETEMSTNATRSHPVCSEVHYYLYIYMEAALKVLLKIRYVATCAVKVNRKYESRMVKEIELSEEK